MRCFAMRPRTAVVGLGVPTRHATFLARGCAVRLPLKEGNAKITCGDRY